MADKILLLDGDASLLRMLGEFLRAEAFIVIAAPGGAEALRLSYKEKPDLVVLDVAIPGMDGWEVCARLRELTDTPIILLTAKNAEADKLRGFRLGADDYVTKPFSFAELAARIRAVLVRARGRRPGEARVYLLGDLRVDLDKRAVQRRGKLVPLTPTEFRLLECLLLRQGQAISERDLAHGVWGRHKQPGMGRVRRYIWLLRQKVEEDPAKPARVITVRGFGYRLDLGD